MLLKITRSRPMLNIIARFLHTRFRPLDVGTGPYYDFNESFFLQDKTLFKTEFGKVYGGQCNVTFLLITCYISFEKGVSFGYR